MPLYSRSAVTATHQLRARSIYDPELGNEVDYPKWCCPRAVARALFNSNSANGHTHGCFLYLWRYTGEDWLEIHYPGSATGLEGVGFGFRPCTFGCRTQDWSSRVLGYRRDIFVRSKCSDDPQRDGPEKPICPYILNGVVALQKVAKIREENNLRALRRGQEDDNFGSRN
ncbi:hypothetical protein J6590_081668 [Homalodisca vitripennis]|nr:hypothetical protein J6590_081668 [Homalodisca vitripennis]